MQKPLGPKDMDCPQWRKPMSKVCHKCPNWIKLAGKHPQTGVDIDEWMCAIPAAVVMIMETANQSRQAGAAIESFRNEVARQSAFVRPLPAIPNGHQAPRLIAPNADARDD